MIKKISLYLFFLTFICSLNAFEKYPKEAWLDDYIARMPWSLYKQYKVKGLGKFWVDNAKDCVKGTIKKGKIWEPYIIKYISKWVKKGDAVIDLGAHMGTITLAMSNIVGPTGKVHSFEAERQFYRELVENIKLNKKENIIPYLSWVGSETTTKEIKWYYGKEYSPVHNPKEPPYLLNMHRLDDFNFKNISLMKIDVECTEDAVLDGAYKTLMKCRPVLIIEIMGGYGHSNSLDVKKRIKHTISKLNKMNYSVRKIWIDDYIAIPKERLKSTTHL